MHLWGQIRSELGRDILIIISIEPRIEMIRRYDIKRRTLQSWESGEREPDGPVKKLLAYAVIMEAQNREVDEKELQN